MCWSLQGIKISGGLKPQNDNLILTIKSYMQKYSQEHKANGLFITCQDVIIECQKLLEKTQMSFNNSLKTKHNHLTMLLRETEMLDKFGSSNKLYAYSKASQVERYLESIKQMKNTTSNLKH